MKTKSIALFFSLLCLLGAGVATTSCEDMFTPENSLVATDLTPQDTVYQMLGIMQKMQKVVDKSILFGEVRADLVDINQYTTEDLQQLSNNNVDTENAYNSPADYYAVINSCNIYLAYVDSLHKSKGKLKYREEVICAKTYRAWTYLELAKIYGAENIPFITEPITTAKDGEDAVQDNGNRKTFKELLDFLIDDLYDYALIDENKGLMPSYGKEGAIFKNAFIPVRLMLAELYLYRGSFTQNQEDFINAVRFYHDYLAFTNEEVPMNSSRAYWRGISFESQSLSDSYWTNFDQDVNPAITAIPMDTIAYYGNTSDIRSVFNSLYNNNYYAYVNPSARYLEISQEQPNCVYVYNSATDIFTSYSPDNKESYPSFNNPERVVGDLRYNSNLYTYNKTDIYHAEYNPNRQTISKYADGNSLLLNDKRVSYITLYRKEIVYLHLAEALNRAGFPETAFAVLKYGLSDTVLEDREKVSQDEYDRLSAITSLGFASNAADWDKNIFITRDRRSGGVNAGGTDIGGGLTVNQWGVHTLGCSDAWADDNYVLPTDMSGWTEYPLYDPDETWTAEEKAAYDEQYEADCAEIDALNEAYLASDEVRQARIEALAKMILDEEALEGAYEGTRFYDLMRYSMASYGDYREVVNAVSKRKGKENTVATGTLTNSNVFIPLKLR